MRTGMRRSAVGVETLEGRVVLSHLAVTVHAKSAPSAARVTIGAAGDSLTDEYATYTPDRSQARNWVEILSATRRASFGPYQKASQGEPRLVGFTRNWARSDSTTSDLVDNQVPGLAEQVRRGRVRYAVVISGDNDFGYFLRSAVGADPAAIPQALAQTEQRAEANIDAAIASLLAANPRAKVVVGTVFDLRQEPSIQAQAAALGPAGQALLDATAGAIDQYNAHIRALADSSPRVALADLAAAQGQINGSGLTSVPFGGTTIDLATPGDDYHHFILGDGVHPGTVAQGGIANAVISAIDAKFGAHIRPLSDAQILRVAAKATKIP